MNQNRKLSNRPPQRYSNLLLHGKGVKFASQSNGQIPSAFPSLLSDPHPAGGKCASLGCPPPGVNAMGRREQGVEKADPSPSSSTRSSPAHVPFTVQVHHHQSLLQTARGKLPAPGAIHKPTQLLSLKSLRFFLVFRVFGENITMVLQYSTV